jgi:hypothetical protein
VYSSVTGLGKEPGGDAVSDGVRVKGGTDGKLVGDEGAEGIVLGDEGTEGRLVGLDGMGEVPGVMLGIIGRSTFGAGGTLDALGEDEGTIGTVGSTAGGGTVGAVGLAGSLALA